MDSIIAILQTHLERIYQIHLCFLDITHQPQTFACFRFFPWMNMCFSLKEKTSTTIYSTLPTKRKKTNGGPSAHRVRHVLSETFPLKVLLNLGPNSPTVTMGWVMSRETWDQKRISCHESFVTKLLGTTPHWLEKWRIFDELRKSVLQFHIESIFNYQPTILLHVTGGLLENKALFFGGCLFGGAWIPRKAQQVATTF